MFLEEHKKNMGFYLQLICCTGLRTFDKKKLMDVESSKRKY